jgi:hypothetical protein
VKTVTSHVPNLAPTLVKDHVNTRTATPVTPVTIRITIIAIAVDIRAAIAMTTITVIIMADLIGARTKMGTVDAEIKMNAGLEDVTDLEVRVDAEDLEDLEDLEIKMALMDVDLEDVIDLMARVDAENKTDLMDADKAGVEDAMALIAMMKVITYCYATAQWLIGLLVIKKRPAIVLNALESLAAYVLDVLVPSTWLPVSKMEKTSWHRAKLNKTRPPKTKSKRSLPSVPRLVNPSPPPLESVSIK